MKKTIFYSLLVILLISCGSKPAPTQTDGSDRHEEAITEDVINTEETILFTMSLPSDWEAIDIGERFPVAIGPEDNDFIPNINFSDEDYYDGSIELYIEMVIELLSNLYSDYQVIQRDNFFTNFGLGVEFVTITGTMNEMSVRQMLFIIPRPGSNMLMGITATASYDHGDKYDSLFMDSVKTFTWTN